MFLILLFFCLIFNTDVIESLGVTPLVHLLESFGRWPMTVTNWTEDGFNWRKTTANIRNFMGLNYLIDVSNFIDVNNTEYSTIYVLLKNIYIVNKIV